MYTKLHSSRSLIKDVNDVKMWPIQAQLTFPLLKIKTVFLRPNILFLLLLPYFTIMYFIAIKKKANDIFPNCNFSETFSIPKFFIYIILISEFSNDKSKMCFHLIAHSDAHKKKTTKKKKPIEILYLQKWFLLWRKREEEKEN